MYITCQYTTNILATIYNVVERAVPYDSYHDLKLLLSTTHLLTRPIAKGKKVLKQ